MRTEQIRALTGIRFFAALWVVVYHVSHANSDFLRHSYPNLMHQLQPVLNRGPLGVDLFFVLSGFVLALNYLDQLGPRFDLAKAGRFLWLRLARVWPAYVFVMLLAGSLILLRHYAWDSERIARLSAPNFFKQLFMVQMWLNPRNNNSSWAGPAWSLSAEWLAYLFFPLLALAALRLHKLLRARWLLVSSGLALVPLVIVVMADGNFTGDHSWMLRIAIEFTAGVLLCAAVGRLRLTDRQRRLAGAGSVLTVLAVVAGLYLLPRTPEPFTANIVLVLFLPLVGFLAIGRGWFVTLLSTRALVLGGGVSYSMYLVHGPLLHFFRDLVTYPAALRLAPAHRFYAELLFVPVIIFVAWLIYTRIEEPSRRMMRRMIDHPFPPVRTEIVPASGPNPHNAEGIADDVRPRSLMPIGHQVAGQRRGGRDVE